MPPTRDIATGPVVKRREFRNLHVFGDLRTYRLPPAGLVSILHRISGAMLFFALPALVWLFDLSVTSEFSHARFGQVFQAGWWIFPAWLVKLGALALIWAYLHHFIAGLRHLVMDVSHAAVSQRFGTVSALVTLGVSLLLAAALGAKLFGVY